METDGNDQKRGLNRRNFVKISALGLAAVAGLTPGDVLAKVPKRWDAEVDVIVVGAGSAGFAAAIEAAQGGAKVVLLEKTPVVGGSSTLCGGALAFAGTDLQAEKNVKDSNELLKGDLLKVGENLNDPVQLQAYLDNQLDTYYWLKKIGVKFVQLSIASGMSVPRAHQVIPPDVIKVLGDTAKARGVTPLMQVSASRLIMDEKTGRIRGVLVERRGKKLNYGARKGVILTSGGFSLNRDLLAKFVPPMAKARAMVGLGCQGDGLKMAWAYGADLVDMPYIKSTFGYHPQCTSTKQRAHVYYRGAIIINKEGKRFVNESISYKLLGDAALMQKDAVAYSLWDAKVREAARGDALSPVIELEKQGLVFQGQTVEELAAKIGVPPQVLAETVKNYNSSIDLGSDAFGRKTLTSGFGKPTKIENPPYYAFLSTGVILGTYGGIRIDGKARVLDIFGEPIPGLFAAGEITGGLHGGAYMTGSAFGKAIIFGRIAGKNVGAEALQKK
ncbi:MAG: flavocytochrome c [Syntrophales bacterium]|nr:flavocytochrome c [Syntrophales bacterium]